jgi:hypothetical protein
MLFTPPRTFSFFALVFVFSVFSQAGDDIQITAAPPPEYEFGKTMRFEASARSESSPIIGATLFVRSAGASRTFVGEARLTPGLSQRTKITAIYELNLSLYSLAPFAPVEYWWEVRDSGGASLTTEPQTFIYEDNRFEWQRREGDVINVYWIEGNSAFGQAALDIANAALARANREIQASLPERVNIYIYPDEQAALKLTERIWAVGHADPVPLKGEGVVIVAVPDDLEASLNLERLIPHELTHILVYQATGDHYSQVPTWLNEGLAVMNQGQPDPDFPAVLAKARAAEQLLSLSNLCGPLPADPAQAQLAYAESESIVRYIRDRYGASGLSALLSAYADGLGCAAGVERGLGIPLEELERRWLGEVLQVQTVSWPRQTLFPWIILTGLVLLSGGLFFVLITINPSRRRNAPS